MRYLLVAVLLSLGLSAQANPVMFYRTLKDLGFDNKRIAKIVTKVKEHRQNQQFNEPFFLITRKFKDATDGYQFFVKRSGELEIQKFKNHSGKLTLGRLEVIDPKLTNQQLIEQRAKLLQLFQGVIDHHNSHKVIDIANGLKQSRVASLIHLTPRQKLRLSQKQWMMSSLFFDTALDEPTKAKYLFDILDVQTKDITQKFSLTPSASSYSLAYSYRSGKVIPYDVPDKRGVNKRQLLNELLHQQTELKVSTPSHHHISRDEADKLHDIIDEIYHVETTTSRTMTSQQLLSTLFSDSSLNDSNKVKYLFEILDIQRADLSKNLSLLPTRVRSAYTNAYIKGTVPRDTVDMHGINKRQLLKELLHQRVNEKVAASSLDHDDAQKIRTLIEEIFHITPKHQPLNSLLTETSLDNSEKIKLLSKILKVRATDIAQKLSIPPKNSSVGVGSDYKYGRSLPRDSVDSHGINRRQLLKEFYHQQVDASPYHTDVADKLHEIIDEVFPTAKKTVQ